MSRKWYHCHPVGSRRRSIWSCCFKGVGCSQELLQTGVVYTQSRGSSQPQHLPVQLLLLLFAFLEHFSFFESLPCPQAQPRPLLPGLSFREVILVGGDVGLGQLVCSLESLLCPEGQNHGIEYTRKFQCCPDVLDLPSYLIVVFRDARGNCSESRPGVQLFGSPWAW